MVEDDEGSAAAPLAGRPERREAVLAAALDTFVRQGYRKTSMDDVAAAADISRPGLYFLFSSKQQLFAAAVTRGLQADLATAAAALGESGRPLVERLLVAFDAWTGRYVGAVGGELSAVAAEHRDLLGAEVVKAPSRFAELVTAAVTDGRPGQDAATSAAIARTLIAVAVGLKQQTSTRQAFGEALRTAVELLLH